MDEELYRVMIESIEPETSFFQVFWTPARHPGQAIESVLRACLRLGLRNPVARELDYLDLDSVPDESFHDEESNVFHTNVRISFPTQKTFVAPFGIIGSGEKGEHDYELIREGFCLTKTEANIYEVEVVIERDSLLNTFLELVKKLPSIRVFWIRIAADWEERGREEFWTNEESITSFLSTHWKDTVANGHVALTVYSNVGQTNLSIDTHKTLLVLTKSARMQKMISVRLRRLGFAQLSDFYSLKYNYHHWHYRPARSKSRTRLVAALKRSGFKLWKDQAPEDEG